MSLAENEGECPLRMRSSHSDIEYRGRTIPVAWYYQQYSNFKNADGSPHLTPEEVEAQVQKKILERKRDIGRITGARFERHSGYRLAFYEREHQLFPEAYKQKVDDKTAESLVKKLARHFLGKRATSIEVRFWGNRQSGAKGLWGNIRLSHNPSIGLICHETAHLRFAKHDKRLMGMMKRMIAYCKKKDWLREEASV